MFTVDACAAVGRAANLVPGAIVVVDFAHPLKTCVAGRFSFPVAINLPIALRASLFFACTVPPGARRGEAGATAADTPRTRAQMVEDPAGAPMRASVLAAICGTDPGAGTTSPRAPKRPSPGPGTWSISPTPNKST